MTTRTATFVVATSVRAKTCAAVVFSGASSPLDTLSSAFFDLACTAGFLDLLCCSVFAALHTPIPLSHIRTACAESLSHIYCRTLVLYQLLQALCDRTSATALQYCTRLCRRCCATTALVPLLHYSIVPASSGFRIPRPHCCGSRRLGYVARPDCLNRLA